VGGSGVVPVLVQVLHCGHQLHARVREVSRLSRICSSTLCSQEWLRARPRWRQEAAGKERENLLQQELSGPVTTPLQPYPGLQGKKKWVYFKAAMKMFGLEQRSRTPASADTQEAE